MIWALLCIYDLKLALVLANMSTNIRCNVFSVPPTASSSYFTSPRTPQTVYESIIGARETNEDKLNSFPTQNKVRLFCVHDGHGGIEAVDYMKESMIGKWNHRIMQNISLSPPSLISEDTNVKLLAGVYNDAITDLQAYESGAVSITAMSVANNRAIYFAWVGDCEGCVFYNDNPNLKNPVVKFSECDSVQEIDFAELKLQPNLAISPMPFLREYCASSPHSLSGGVRFQIPQTKQILQSSIFFQSSFTPTEYMENFLGVIPRNFEHPSAQKEYTLAKLHNDSLKPPIPTLLDVSTHNVGTTQLTLDVRFSGAIQPTRSLGDFNPVNHSILRHPTVMRVLIPPKLASSCSILLCSDGAFSGHAFKGISQVCRFVTNPVAFFHESFYFRGQVLTERLITAGLLPENLYQQNCQLPCHYEWKFLCRTWPQILTFLRNQHWQSITSPQILSVLETGSREQYFDWLNACDASIEFLEKRIPNFNYSIENTKTASAVVAAHLAVIMGSSDNVTFVIAEAFAQ
jgi:hypothetical protein